MLSQVSLNALKKGLISGVLAAALAALVGFQAAEAAAQVEQLWSVVVHFEYADGFEFDYVLRTGVSTAEMAGVLQDCGRSHRTRSVVRYHCYAVPE